jgi:phage gp45-like
VAFINGDPSNGAIVGTNHQSYGIKNMGNGAVALYDMYGNTLVLSSTGISITSASNLTLTGQNVVIHATQSLKYDADGNGTEFTSSTRNDYVTGSTNTTHNLNPPQVP